MAMNDLTIFPAELAEMSVGQLAKLPPHQMHEVATHLNDLIDWANQAKTKLDSALEQRFGESARTALRDSGRDFGTTHITEDSLRIKFELPKRINWDQKQLAEIAERIVASGKRVEDYIDVKLSVSESRFAHWPPEIQEPFVTARTVKAGKASFALTLAQDAGDGE
jgi:hypothetical protein